jgi:hypothetical protein
MAEVVLGGRRLAVEEPVFGALRQIVPAYNRLTLEPERSARETADDINRILALLLGKAGIRKLRWRRPTAAELQAFLAAVPELCGLVAQRPGGGDAADAWDVLYWRIILLTGWTWAEVDQTMTMSKLQALDERLNVSPPVNELVASYLDYKPQRNTSQADALRAMIAQAKAARAN